MDIPPSPLPVDQGVMPPNTSQEPKPTFRPSCILEKKQQWGLVLALPCRMVGSKGVRISPAKIWVNCIQRSCVLAVEILGGNSALPSFSHTTLLFT